METPLIRRNEAVNPKGRTSFGLNRLWLDWIAEIGGIPNRQPSRESLGSRRCIMDIERKQLSTPTKQCGDKSVWLPPSLLLHLCSVLWFGDIPSESQRRFHDDAAKQVLA